jgi:hypothetical protein
MLGRAWADLLRRADAIFIEEPRNTPVAILPPLKWKGRGSTGGFAANAPRPDDGISMQGNARTARTGLMLFALSQAKGNTLQKSSRTTLPKPSPSISPSKASASWAMAARMKTWLRYAPYKLPTS